MLRQKLVVLLRYFMERQAYVHFIPSVHWDSGSQTLHTTLSLRRKIITWFITTVEVLFFGLVAISAPSLLNFYSQETTSLVVIVLFLICCSTLPSHQMGGVVYKAELVDYANSFLLLQKPLDTEEGGGNKRVAEYLLDQSLKILKFYGNYVPIAVFAYIVIPSAEFNIGYFYFGKSYFPGFIFALLLSWMTLGLWTYLGLCVSLFATYCWDSMQTLRTMRERLQNGSMSIGNGLEMYRKLQVMHNLYNCSLGKGFLGITLFYSALIPPFTISSLISFWSRLNPVLIILQVSVSIVFLTVASTFFNLTIKLEEESTKFIFTAASTLRHLNVNPRSQPLKSYPPLSTSFVGFFKSYRIAILVYFRVIVEYVIMLTLSYPNM